ncbi:hypothetical protein [Vibrio scophthalmi]|uniref:Uncharacterized protein n=1 Tax=Vibrio scophthalmi TaxID=45658 RepID=A0A1E3WMF8_9VIBR|nr:hypothetical protein [Vibrio scophthalmi]ODS10162.1 hypothetical protein VSF3289_00417 [Vibrio scophthalmi]
MRRTITLQPSGEYAFDVGRNALILILRNATKNVVLKGDSLTPIELSRSDIVNIETFRTKRMFLANENDTAITVEFQLSDTPISIREQRMALEGGVTVTDIVSPVIVSEIFAPVKVAGTVPVTIKGGVSVEFPPNVEVGVSNFPAVQAVRGEVAVSNFPDVQVTDSKATQFNGLAAITIGSTGTAEIPANPSRKGLMVQAGEDNTANVMIAGCVRVKPDGFAMIPASNALTVQGVEGDVITLGEVV